MFWDFGLQAITPSQESFKIECWVWNEFGIKNKMMTSGPPLWAKREKLGVFIVVITLCREFKGGIVWAYNTEASEHVLLSLLYLVLRIRTPWWCHHGEEDVLEQSNSSHDGQDKVRGDRIDQGQFPQGPASRTVICVLIHVLIYRCNWYPHSFLSVVPRDGNQAFNMWTPMGHFTCNP